MKTEHLTEEEKELLEIFKHLDIKDQEFILKLLSMFANDGLNDVKNKIV